MHVILIWANKKITEEENNGMFEIFKKCVKVASPVWLFVTPWTIISKPEYWSRYPFPSPGDLPNPGIKPRSPALQADSLPAEPQGKPKNTGVGRLSLLQQIFPTEELYWDLLNCRWILFQLSYQGSPFKKCIPLRHLFRVFQRNRTITMVFL